MACLLAKQTCKWSLVRQSTTVTSSIFHQRCTLANPPAQQQRANLSFFTRFGEWNQSVATSSVVEFSKTNLIALHEWLHLPWFAEIALVTLAVRCFIAFPLTINQRRIIDRYEALQPEILAISNTLKKKFREEAFILGRSKQKTQVLYSRAFRKEMNRLIVRDNCHPIKASMVPLFQIPVWIILSHSYRNMAKLFPDPNDPASLTAYAQLQNEGLLWFHDLTVPDPTGILPLATALVNLTIIQLYVNERRRSNIQDSLFIKVITNGSRLFSLVIIPIGLVMPANMSFYWLVSSSIGLAQNMFLMNPNVKKQLGIESKLVMSNNNKVDGDKKGIISANKKTM